MRQADRPRPGALKPHLMLLAALLVALSVAFTGAASAQATPFQASVTATALLPSGGCSDGAYSCGTANIAGYGAASWNLYVTGYTSVQTSCGSSYTAMTYFTLPSDGSTLVLNESGPLCGPGVDANGYFKGRFPRDYGRPYSALGTWTIDTTDSTGVFGSLLGGPGTGGTDTLYFAGAHTAGSYSGTLG
jgi:hypothetical protein